MQHLEEWMNEWAFIVTYTEVQAKLQQSTRPYIYNIQCDKGVGRTGRLAVKRWKVENKRRGEEKKKSNSQTMLLWGSTAWDSEKKLSNIGTYEHTLQHKNWYLQTPTPCSLRVCAFRIDQNLQERKEAAVLEVWASPQGAERMKEDILAF